MLNYFKVKNFKSIQEIQLNMDFAEGKAPNGYRRMEMLPFLNYCTKRFVPVFAVYGPNASGKSNLIVAMDTCKAIIENGSDAAEYTPNKINPICDYTLFELDVFLNECEYTYSIKYNDFGIVAEKLAKNANTIIEIENGNIIINLLAKNDNEIYSKEKLSQIYNTECVIKKDASRFQTKTFLSRLAINYPSLSDDILCFYQYIAKKFTVYSKNEFDVYSRIEESVKLGFYKDESECFEKIASVLKKLDISIKNMGCTVSSSDINKRVVGQNMMISSNYSNYSTDVEKFLKNKIFCDNVYTTHIDINGNDVRFKLKDESDGTKKIMGILAECFLALNSGNVLVVDELELSLHPYILKEIAHLFKYKKYNKNNAQLIFTTHCTDYLEDDYLRVSEVAVIDKTLKKGSVLKRVSDFNGIRNVNNFRIRYLNGEFTGIPFPYI